MKTQTIRWGAALIWVTLFGLGCWLAFSTTRVQTQLNLLLPSDGSPIQQLLVKHLSEGATSRLILIGLRGAPIRQLAKASSRLAVMMQESQLFSSVRNGDFPTAMPEHELLFQYRYLLTPTLDPKQFTVPALRDALTQRLNDLTAPLPPFLKARIPHDPTGEFLKILHAWHPSNSPHKYHGVWVSPDRHFALLAVETKASGFDLDAQEHILAYINNSVSKINQEDHPDAPIQVITSGPPVFAVHSRATITKEAQWLSFLATLLVIGFLFIRYRSAVLVSLSIVPLASGLLAGLLAVNFAYGFIHGITLAFGISLIGVAIDYPIHLFSHLESHSPPSTIMERIWPVMRLGAVTTTIGYGALMFSGFPGLSQLGLFAIVGLLTAAFVTKWVLPSLIPSQIEVTAIPQVIISQINRLSHFSLVLPIFMLLSLGYILSSDRSIWEKDLANLSPIPQQAKTMDSWLRKNMGAPDVRDVIVLTGPSEEAILVGSEQLRPRFEQLLSQHTISGYDMAARYLPSMRWQQQRQGSLPDPQALANRVNQAQEGLPFKPGLFDNFIHDIETARHLAPLNSQRLSDTVFGPQIKTLLFPDHEKWIGVITLQGVKDRKSLLTLSTESNNENLHYLDLKQESNRMVTRYREEMVKLLSVGFFAIVVILIIVLRSFSGVARVLFPMVTAVMTVVAVLHLAGEKLALFHLASLLLVVGIGLDYTLFVNREGQSEKVKNQTVLGVLVCALTTILVFGLLAFSQTPVLHGIGITASVGAFCCLIFSLMFRSRQQNFEPIR